MTYIPDLIDQNTSSKVSIDIAHHKIHTGSHFVVCDFQNGLSNNTSQDYFIEAPDTANRIHFFYNVDVSVEAEVILHEGTTVSASGTVLTSFNNNRNSANTTGLIVYKTPTVTGVGSVICTQRLGAGKTAGGTARNESEFILGQNGKYLLRVTARVNNLLESTVLKWYEV